MSKLYNKNTVPADTWAKLLKMIDETEKKDIPAEFKSILSKDEAKHVAIIDGEVMRPYYTITHPHHGGIGYVMDHDTARALVKHWNRMSRPKIDHIKKELVILSSFNNKANRK